jgi:indolepyruvate ferredoxin oxidoreductase beta subunit
MKTDIVLAGVGGQGILTIAAIIGQVAVDQGWNVKQSEVHGMAQRGGSVLAHLRLAQNAVKSDLITEGSAELLVAMEPLEALRQKSFLSKDGFLLSNTVPVKNIKNYPDLDKVLVELQKHPKQLLLDAEEVAKNAGSVRCSNIVLLGAIAEYLPFEKEIFAKAIEKLFASKGEKIVAMNLRAFELGSSC